MSAGQATPLEQQQRALAEVQEHDFRAGNLLRLIEKRIEGGSVVDVGCGGGGLVARLLQRGCDARGIDTSATTVDAAREYLVARGLDPQRITIDTVGSLLRRGVRADNVVSMDCLEHVERDDQLFAELADLARPGGRLLITVPAMQALYGQRDRAIGHYRRYDRARLRTLAEGQPVVIEELRYWNILGVVPTFVSERLLKRPVDESFRYGPASRPKRLLRGALRAWFRVVENSVRPPLGLTLVMVARRYDQASGRA